MSADDPRGDRHEAAEPPLADLAAADAPADGDVKGGGLDTSPTSRLGVRTPGKIEYPNVRGVEDPNI